MHRSALPTLLCFLLLISVFLAGCSEPPTIPPTTQPTVPPTREPTPAPTPATGTADVTGVVDANNQFAFDLYSSLTSDPAARGANLFFSPFSISSALAITYEGARGTTADEIQSVFHFPADDTTRREGYFTVTSDLTRPNTNYTLRIANALWAERTYPFLPAYLQIARESYRADATNLDFITAPEESRLTINQWVEEQTEEKIKDLIPPGVIDPLTRLVITNAIYFHGTWQKQFDPENTNEADFYPTPSTTTRVPMMQQTDQEARFPYTETDNLQALVLPYAHGEGRELSMLILLPKSDSLSAVEQTLSWESLSTLRNNLTSERVNVYLPKFRLETKYDLTGTLASQGMPTAFTADADLSGMDGTHNLQITAVIHQAYVDVNEEGTEAAAATGVVVGLTSIQEENVYEFRADHPFLFLILDEESGAILFLGRVANTIG
jgi:serpin B